MEKNNEAVGYLRVSGKGQVNGFGFDRQEELIESFAERNGYHLIAIYREEGVSGAMEEGDRPAFKEMLIEVTRQKTRFIIIEGMDRLARELRVQENLCVYIASKGIQLLSANTGENITQAIESDPMKKALIQIQGVFAELDKNQVVKKLRNGRDQAKKQNEKSKRCLTLDGRGKCEGRKSYKQTHPELVATAKKLYRKPRKGRRLSLSKISEHLFQLGYATSKGKPFSASQVMRLIE
jgi:DNA invertase Pin-like site-specific DNA recombinase